MPSNSDLGKMGPTGLAPETIVVGVLFLSWIFLIVLTLVGLDWIDPAALAPWVPLLAVLLVAFSYVAGGCAMLYLIPLRDYESSRANRIVAARKEGMPSAFLIQVRLLREMPPLEHEFGEMMTKLTMRFGYAANLVALGAALAVFLSYRVGTRWVPAFASGGSLILAGVWAYLMNRRMYQKVYSAVYDTYAALQSHETGPVRRDSAPPADTRPTVG